MCLDANVNPATGFGVGSVLYIYKPGQEYFTITNIPIWAVGGLNNLGDIVGTMSMPNGYSSAGVLYRNGVITYLGDPNGLVENTPSAINDWGQIVGTSFPGGGSPPAEPFLWQNGLLQTLNAPVVDGIIWAGANAINNQGQIAGWAAATISPLAGLEPHPVIWENANAKPYDIGIAPGTNYGYAIGMNNLGEVIGYCQTDTGPYVYSDFVYINGTRYDLNDSLVQNSGYTIVRVFAINDFGVILAQAKHVGDGDTTPYHTVLLKPR